MIAVSLMSGMASPISESKSVHVYAKLKGHHGWMDDMRFYVLFNSISVITG